MTRKYFRFGGILSETLDGFLGGRVKLVQPSEGYRAGIDPIFLSAALNPKAEEKILDVGAGVGVAAISLAVRCPHAKVVGLELQQDLVDLALKNIEANQLKERVEIIRGDILSPPSFLTPNSFDQIMTNPPYYENMRSKSSPIPSKAQANIETVDLGNWIQFCLRMLKPKGTFTMIHRSERLGEILSLLENRIGSLTVYPLWVNANKPARRIIIQGRKGVKGELRLSPGMMLHGGTEKYSFEAEAVLRHAEPLVIQD